MIYDHIWSRLASLWNNIVSRESSTMHSRTFNSQTVSRISTTGLDCKMKRHNIYKRRRLYKFLPAFDREFSKNWVSLNSHKDVSKIQLQNMQAAHFHRIVFMHCWLQVTNCVSLGLTLKHMPQWEWSSCAGSRCIWRGQETEWCK